MKSSGRSLNAALLCGLAALLTWLSLPGVGWWPLAFTALAPLALALRRTGPWRGLWLGLLYGFSFVLASIWWVSRGLMTLVKLGPVPAWAVTMVLCLCQALPYACFGLLCGLMARWGRPLGPLRAALWLAALVAGIPALFPGSPAHALYGQPLLIQAADLGGWPLVLFWLALANWLLAGVISGPRRRAGRQALALAGVLALVCAYGALRLGQYDGPPPDGAATVNVMAVQPDIPIKPPRQGRPGLGDTIGSMMAWTARQAAAHPEAGLIVWPEVPWTIGCGDEMPGGIIRGMLAGPEDRRLLIPCRDCIIDPTAPPEVKTYVTTEANGQQSSLRVSKARLLASYNAAAMWDRHGQRRPLHRKIERFPFSEYLPLAGLPGMKALFPKVQGVDAGQRPVVMDLGRGRRVVPMLCYEALAPRVAPMGIAAGGNLLVSMSNDIWFGADSAGRFHLALALFRSVECRAPLVMVANSGFGAHISAAGRILPGSLTPPGRRLVSSRTLAIPPRRGPFPWLHTWLYGAGLLACALDLALALGRRRRSGNGGELLG